MQRFYAEKAGCKRNQQPLSIIMGDIDNFKLYNDSYGHSKGNICLKGVAQAIHESLKRPADFCARYGGEEFIILLPNTPPRSALKVAERIQANIEAKGIVHTKSMPTGLVTISLGISSALPGLWPKKDELISQADMAMYRSKGLGRNQISFFNKIDDSTSE
ncbi:GGDEF domain-containing protein [Desulfotalea psychrophila]|uniref:diguanylate cyclase n=1 Tax=Desulfotalea psychrophila (strain LSv54 / DSM 12343) TaxID=177439 RepID=Q6ALR6_DESPS|nr:GGDEF domain-containing protein [Desulfotalea psychrophila]CAG36709.1 hypothetical protein DP1980 [Desulfotalea psychrophila LSv54]